MSAATYAARRAALADRMGDGVAVFPAMPVATRNSDVEHAYRQHSDLYYLTGFDEPGSALVLRAGSAAPDDASVHTTLFVRPKDREREIWDGFRHGTEGAVADFAMDEAFTIGELGKKLPALLSGSSRLHYDVSADPVFDQHVFTALRGAALLERRTGAPSPTEIVSPKVTLHEQRLRKGPDELELMRRASAITKEAHHAAMRVARPGGFEYEVEAELLRVFRKGGAERPAYDSIVGSGPNATVLHYRRNDRRMQEGDLLLIDAGCEYGYYASDVTRTFPVSGTFSKPQRALYELVLAAQDASIEAVRPGASMDTVHDASVRVLTQGMLDLGLLDSGVGLDEAIEQKKYQPYYMHRTSHWLGMDVHDVGAAHVGGAQRAFEPGFVLTVEPGIYVGEDADVPAGAEDFRGIGIRIEDDIVVTASGHENLTDVVKAPDEVEAMVKSS